MCLIHNHKMEKQKAFWSIHLIEDTLTVPSEHLFPLMVLAGHAHRYWKSSAVLTRDRFIQDKHPAINID